MIEQIKYDDVPIEKLRRNDGECPFQADPDCWGNTACVILYDDDKKDVVNCPTQQTLSIPNPAPPECPLRKGPVTVSALEVKK